MNKIQKYYEDLDPQQLTDVMHSQTMLSKKQFKINIEPEHQ